MSALDAFLSTWSNARSTFGDGAPQTGAQYDSSGKLSDMKMDVVARSVAVLVGMTCGYVFWLAGITALTVIVPMQHIIIAGGVFLSRWPFGGRLRYPRWPASTPLSLF